MKDLMIIESPNKIKTIGKYLKDRDIEIIATYGHVRKLSKFCFKGMGFNRNTFDIKWQKDNKQVKINGKKVNVIKIINEKASKTENIYLSTDPDREGEAISWHIYEILSDENKKKCKRIVFNEITQEAIKKAFKEPRDLDENQISSYLARRLLDRWIGFKLSKYTSQKIGGISAGRVQSIALKFLKDRDKEIKNFIPDHWYKLETCLDKNISLNLKTISTDIENIKLKEDKDAVGICFSDKESAEAIKNSLNKKYKLIEISKPSIVSQSPPAAFKTSTLFKAAINKLGMSSTTVAKQAQKLYEGVEINGETLSLITYPRTDRNDFSQTFLQSAETFIKEQCGSEYLLLKKNNTSKNDNKLVQGAHEGIRPTNINLRPENIKSFLDPATYKLYELIWVYSVCSLMSKVKFTKIKYKFENNKNIFTTSTQKEIFDGYKKIMNHYWNSSSQKNIDENYFVQNKEYDLKNIEILKIDKSPPPHYNQAALIESLDAKGIGRPSTYDKISNVILDRDYATKENKKLMITDVGLKVSQDLEKNFSSFIAYDYTTKLENELDNIANNSTNWKNFLDEVFTKFDDYYELAEKTIVQKVEDKTCVKCSSDLIYRYSYKTKTRFIGCSQYPDCDYIESLNPIPKAEETGEKCPECNENLVKRKDKWNNFFIGCSKYPTCKYIKLDQLEEKCPKCNKNLVKRKNKWKSTFIACPGFPECKYVKKTPAKDKENKNN